MVYAWAQSQKNVFHTTVYFKKMYTILIGRKTHKTQIAPIDVLSKQRLLPNEEIHQEFLRTGGGPPVVLFYKRFYLTFLFFIFIFFLFF